MNRKFYAFHVPSCEDWVLLGINRGEDKVCAAGWPPTMAKLSDCANLEDAGELTDAELEYRNKTFGGNWE